MKPTLCSRCKKNLAVIFITKIDGGKTVNEGLCLKCAKEMGIKPVDDMIERMGLSEDDLENLNGEMTEAMNGLEGLLGQNQSDDSQYLAAALGCFLEILPAVYGFKTISSVPCGISWHINASLLMCCYRL